MPLCLSVEVSARIIADKGGADRLGKGKVTTGIWAINMDIAKTIIKLLPRYGDQLAGRIIMPFISGIKGFSGVSRTRRLLLLRRLGRAV